MDTAKTGSLSVETPWVAEEYFATRCRRQQNFLSSTRPTTSWCSRMRYPNPRKHVPFLKDNTKDHAPTVNDLLTRFGITEVGYDSRTPPFILVQSAALERVPTPSPLSSPRLGHIQSKKFLEFCNRSRELSGSTNGKDTSEGEILAMTEAITKEEWFNNRQTYIENDFDRLEPCYDWYLSREQKFNTNLETRSAHAAMGLGNSSSIYSPGNTGGFLRRPGTAPEMKMTRSDRPTTGDWLVIRKLRLLPRKTESPTPPSRFQRRVVDDRSLLDIISGKDDEGLGVRSEKMADEETLSWTTGHGAKGTSCSSEDGGLGPAERLRPGSRNSQRVTPASPRDIGGLESDVINVDQQSPQMPKDSASILRIASGVLEQNSGEQSNVLESISHPGEDDEIGDGVSDKELPISFGYELPAAADYNYNQALDSTITHIENGTCPSAESSDKTGINKRDLLQNLRSLPVAAAASIQRPKTAGRKRSSANKHRCLRKKAPEKQKINDSEQQVQEETTPKDRGPNRRESRRKRRSRQHCQTLTSDVDTLVEAVADDSSPIAESLTEQSSCRETLRSSEESPSESLSLKRRNQIDAALRRDLRFVELSRSERVTAYDDPQSIPPLELVGDTEGGEDPAIGKPLPVMDTHKNDKSKQNGRIAFSQRSCRFELPLDMKLFEKLSPQEYLRKYCRISPRRQILYKRIFLKYVPLIGWFPGKDLLKFLTELLGEAACDSDVAYICDLLQITDETKVDLEIFSVTAAVTERLLYPQFVTQHTRHILDYKKEEIEKADFSALLTKLSGIQVRPEMKRLVDAIK